MDAFGTIRPCLDAPRTKDSQQKAMKLSVLSVCTSPFRFSTLRYGVSHKLEFPSHLCIDPHIECILSSYGFNCQDGSQNSPFLLSL